MAKAKRTNAEWQKLIDECEGSGQTQEAWCMTKGINLYTYRDRARRLRKLEVRQPEGRTSRQRNGQAICGNTDETHGAQNWVEITPRLSDETSFASEAGHTPAPSGTLSIEIGKLRISADRYYPVAALSALLKELARLC